MAEVYVVCKNNCMYPAMTKEETIAAIVEATGKAPTLSGDAFINQVVNQNTGENLKFWRGTWADYNAIAKKDEETYYIITDQNLPDEVFTTYLHEKQDRVHYLTNENGGSNLKFIATANFVAGDMFNVNGVTVTAFMNDGVELPNDYFKAGSIVNCFLTAGVLCFNGSNGNPAKLSALPISGNPLANNTKYTIPQSMPVDKYKFVPPDGWAHGTFYTGDTPNISFTNSSFLADVPEFEPNKRYEFDVVDGVWAFAEVVNG